MFKKYILSHLLGIVSGVAAFAIVATLYIGTGRKDTKLLVDDVMKSVFLIEHDSELGSSIGTGYLVRPRLVVTNNHVVGQNLFMDIYNIEGKKFTGRVVAKDPTSDIAILELPEDFDHQNYRKLRFCRNDEELSIGDPVVAIGHPWGLKWSVSEGIVSQKDRFVPNMKPPMIQTDTKVLQGNSGGPLFKLNGCVAGMNTFVLARRDKEGKGFGEYSFSVDGEFIQERFDELMELKTIRAFVFGVTFKTDDLEVASVVEGGNAEKMKIKIGDRIVSIDGKNVHDIQAVRKRLSKIRANQSFSVDIIRDGKKLSILTKNT